VKDQKFAAIPTVYKGVQFRSRLEARWAAFFDLRRMAWEYEPFDLKGYIPDFLVEGEFLQEVKPARDHLLLIDAAAKVDASGWKGYAEILGGTPHTSLIRRMNCHSIVPTFSQKGRRLGDRITIEGTWDWEVADQPNDDEVAAWTEAGNLTQYKSPRKR
jgi:hypothetical protein